MPEFTVVKTSLKSVCRTNDVLRRIKQYAERMDKLIRYAYLFARFIFVNELALFPGEFAPRLAYFITRKFFENLIKIIGGVTRRNVPDRDTNMYRNLIDHYLEDFCTISGYQVPPNEQHENFIGFLSQNSSSYAATQMESAYLGTIKQHFGRKFREAINYTVDIKNLERQLRREMVGSTTRQKKAMVSQLLRQPLKQFKEALENAIVNHDAEIPANVAQDNIFARHWDSLIFLVNCYPPTKQFLNGNLYADCRWREADHMYAFYSLAEFSEGTRGIAGRKGMSLIQCFPLRSSLVPQYVQLDTSILKQQLIGGSRVDLARHLGTLEAKLYWWNQAMYVLDDNAAFNLNGEIRQVADDIDEVVLGAFADQPRGDAVLRFRGTIYTDGVGLSIVKSDVDTTATEVRRQNMVQEDEEYAAYIQDDIATEDAAENADRLAALRANNVVYMDPGRRDIQFGIHERHNRNNKAMYRVTKNRRNAMTRVKRYRSIRRRARTDRVNHLEEHLSGSPSKSTVNPFLFRVYLLRHAHSFRELSEHYTNTLTVTGQPLHRKLRLSAIINSNRFYQQMAIELQNLGDDGVKPHLIMGNYSAPNVRYQEPIPGKQLRKKLHSFGFKMSFIDEYLTSQTCPLCLRRTLTNFRLAQNPRPARTQQRNYRPLVLRWGLVRCTNRDCLTANGHPHVFNRDMSAVLNFQTIVHNFRETGQLPRAFRRPERQ